MKIGIDATCWRNNRGFGRFTRDTLTALFQLDSPHYYYLFTDQPLMELDKSIYDANTNPMLSHINVGTGVDCTIRELVETIASALVDHPEAVEVNEVEGERSTILELKVSPEDMGKVIGKQGRIAKAIRTVVKAAATKEDKRVVVEII